MGGREGRRERESGGGRAILERSLAQLRYQGLTRCVPWRSTNHRSQNLLQTGHHCLMGQRLTWVRERACHREN